MFLLTAALVFVAALFGARLSNAAVASQKRSPRLPASRQKQPAVKKPRIDYARFSHTTHVVTQKLTCNLCHQVPSKNWKAVRQGEAAFPDVSDFPEHSACLDCHRQQFFARERPAPVICSNCHIANSPRDTSRWLFPSLGDLTDASLKRRAFVSEFGVGFPHDKHIDVVGSNDLRRAPGTFVTVSLQDKPTGAAPKSCSVCHTTYQPQGNSSEEYVTKPPKTLGDGFWLKKGTFKTIPNSHTVCFTCHNADSGIAPDSKDCHVCHQLRTAEPGEKADFDPKLAADMGLTDGFILARWPRRISAGAFRHEGGEHPDLNCLGCHNAASSAFNTLDAKTLKVPVKSCGGAEGCHITATSDDGGALNFELDQKKKDPAFVCTKCHVAFGKESVPENHPQAIPGPKPKMSPS